MSWEAVRLGFGIVVGVWLGLGISYASIVGYFKLRPAWNRWRINRIRVRNGAAPLDLFQ